ncbi:hypothetical protein ON021_23560, partial [Microcoleus sp. HI-ES]|nr:hypothetical protein [Microcoleus sp. HI-ES]
PRSLLSTAAAAAAHLPVWMNSYEGRGKREEGRRKREEHLIFVKTLLLPPSFFLFPPVSCLQTPFFSWAALIEMLPRGKLI